MKNKKLPVLPPMKCDSGCGDCCGVVPATAAEYQEILHFAKKLKIKPKLQGLTCPFYQGGACSIYPVRPTLCRLFGYTEGLPCSRGYNTNVLRDDQVRAILKARGPAVVFLHQALVDDGQAESIEASFEVLVPAVLRSVQTTRSGLL